MSAPASIKTKRERPAIDRVLAANERLQHQVDNQIASINRLLTNGSYDDEMRELHRQLAEAQRLLDKL